MVRDLTRPTEDAEGGGEPPSPIDHWRVVVTAEGRPVHVQRVGAGKLTIGAAPDNDLVLEDPKVSRHHLQVEVGPAGVQVRDLGSKNGTWYQASRLEVAELPRTGGVLLVGASEIAIRPDDVPQLEAVYPGERCGRLIGRSEPMRRLFSQIAKVAVSSSTVLISGETGTGKELVAEAVHALGARAARRLVVLDCGAVPAELIESELFGHVRGAFTGAVATRAGAFEQADGGTLLLDEIGELDLQLQPRLLRVLEAGTFRPVGSEAETRVDVRVVAATLRNLPQLVAEGRFREDLFFRLSVVHLEVPSLREHIDDLPLLVERFLADLGAPPLRSGSLEVMAAYPWPGNVRQLRNVLERAAVMAGGGSIQVRAEDLQVPDVMKAAPALLYGPYKEAKHVVLEQFTRDYLTALLERHQGNLSAASREARLDRNWLAALAARYHVRVGG